MPGNDDAFICSNNQRTVNEKGKWTFTGGAAVSHQYLYPHNLPDL
jgi:hypothetical protein